MVDSDVSEIIFTEISSYPSEFLWKVESVDKTVVGTILHGKRGATIMDWVSPSEKESIFVLFKLRQICPWIGIFLGEQREESRDFWVKAARAGLVQILEPGLV